MVWIDPHQNIKKCLNNLNNGKYPEEHGRARGKLLNANSLKGRENEQDNIGLPSCLVQKVVHSG